jgi:hypothetical protein
MALATLLPNATPVAKEGISMRALTRTIARTVVWGWAALGLGCLLIEGVLSSDSARPQATAAPIERVLVTPLGPAGS